jgi:hypothetical protein
LITRLVLAALAVVAIGVGAESRRTDHRCAHAKAAAKKGEPADAARCGDPRDRALIALYLLRRNQRGAALDVAKGMTRATPDDYLGWLVVWRLSGDRDALARARALNPRGTPRA